MKKKKIVPIIVTSLVVIVIAVAIAAVIIVNRVPSMIAEKEIKDALETGNLTYVQTIYTKYFHLDVPQNVSTEYYGDTLVTTSGSLVTDEMRAVSDVLQEYYGTIYVEVESNSFNDSSEMYDYFRQEYGNIIVDEENNFNAIWETYNGSYYVLDETKDSYNKLVDLCTNN